MQALIHLTQSNEPRSQMKIKKIKSAKGAQKLYKNLKVMRGMIVAMADRSMLLLSLNKCDKKSRTVKQRLLK
jgi:hypothetical protein